MEKIIKKLGELKLLAREKFGVNVQFHVVMNGRLTSTAGRAFYESGKLEFSSKLYAENQEAFIERTVTHEFAHLLAFQLYGAAGTGHGANWKYCMDALGANDITRCHSYTVEKRATGKKYEMFCDCRTHEISPQRMAWVNKGKVYHCVHCNANLRKVK